MGGNQTKTILHIPPVRNDDSKVRNWARDDPWASRLDDNRTLGERVEHVRFDNMTHGRQYAYKMGCKCDECREWKNEEQQKYREKRKRRKEWERLMKGIQNG